MIKMILIERCGDCPCIRWTGEKMICCKTDKEINPLSPDFNKYEAGYGTPDWCPLNDFPEYREKGEVVIYTKKEPLTEELSDKLIDFGFNECLTEMLDGFYFNSSDVYNLKGEHT